MSRAGRVSAVCFVVALWSVATLPPARAQELTAAEFHDLADRAVADSGARIELRDVRSVDGRRVDVDGALEGATAAQETARLEALAAEAPTTIVAGSAARAEAAEILAGRRFNPPEPPRPFQGIIRNLSDWLRDVFRPVGEWLDDLALRLPGGWRTLWTILAVIVIVLAVVVTTRVSARKTRFAGPRSGPDIAPEKSDDPRALERAALAAEERGDLTEAIRLRFRAGLLRLDGAGAIRFRPSITTAEISRTLRSRTFDALAATFDRVVYGGRRPEGKDVESAREGWQRLRSEVAAR